MAEVIWTDNAVEDLNDIGEYIARDSECYAEITVLKLFKPIPERVLWYQNLEMKVSDKSL